MSLAAARLADREDPWAALEKAGPPGQRSRRPAPQCAHGGRSQLSTHPEPALACPLPPWVPMEAATGSHSRRPSGTDSAGLEPQDLATGLGRVSPRPRLAAASSSGRCEVEGSPLPSTLGVEPARARRRGAACLTRPACPLTSSRVLLVLSAYCIPAHFPHLWGGRCQRYMTGWRGSGLRAGKALARGQALPERGRARCSHPLLFESRGEAPEQQEAGGLESCLLPHPAHSSPRPRPPPRLIWS